jgi:hypothetical protein
VVLESDHGTIRRTVNVAADRTAQLSEAIYSGWLHVSAPIELTISEGSRVLTLDEQNQVLLSAGAHQLQLENRTLRYRETRRVDIKPGELTRIAIAPPASTISVTSSEPAEILVDGERIGETPLTDHPVLLGARDILARSSSGAERRFTLTITAAPARLEVDFGKP